MSDEPKANTSAEVVLKWGDGRYLFALKGRQIEHLEKACNAGIQDISTRLMSGSARYADIRKTVELGLEGGGMPPVLVAEKMERFFDGQPLASMGDPSSPLATAQAITMAMWFGVADLDEGKPKPGEARAGNSPANSSQATGRRSSTAARTRPTSKRTASMK